MLFILSRVASVLPRPLRRHATDARLALLVQIGMFATVGVAGLLVDVAVVYLLRDDVGLYAAGFASYLVAATVTWAINRAWTFRGASGEGGMVRQWLRFLMANLVGFALNRGAYVILIAASPLCVRQPVIAVAAGAVAGMGANFSLSRRLVFRS